MGLQTAIVDWLDERFELVDAVDGELYRRVPNYATSSYRYLGGVAAMLVAPTSLWPATLPATRLLGFRPLTSTRGRTWS